MEVNLFQVLFCLIINIMLTRYFLPLLNPCGTKPPLPSPIASTLGALVLSVGILAPSFATTCLALALAWLTLLTLFDPRY